VLAVSSEQAQALPRFQPRPPSPKACQQNLSAGKVAIVRQALGLENVQHAGCPTNGNQLFVRRVRFRDAKVLPQSVMKECRKLGHHGNVLADRAWEMTVVGRPPTSPEKSHAGKKSSEVHGLSR
jgi:hypothetical protein